MLQENFLYPWNLHVILHVVHFLFFENLYMGPEKAHLYRPTSDFTRPPRVTFHALYSQITPTPSKI